MVSGKSSGCRPSPGLTLRDGYTFCPGNLKSLQPRPTMSDNSSLQTNTLLLVIIAILLPPLAVYLKTKSVGSTLINLVLMFLFYFPGLIHALYVILKK
jgi:uncharacterized membrane protein YqaE (UPF0057 family)